MHPHRSATTHYVIHGREGWIQWNWKGTIGLRTKYKTKKPKKTKEKWSTSHWLSPIQNSTKWNTRTMLLMISRQRRLQTKSRQRSTQDNTPIPDKIPSKLLNFIKLNPGFHDRSNWIRRGTKLDGLIVPQINECLTIHTLDPRCTSKLRTTKRIIDSM